MPTTLPTFDEVIGVDGIDETNIADHYLSLTASDRDHVFTLHAELEGQKLAPSFERLLEGWRAQGHQLVAMADYHAALDLKHVPLADIAWGEVPGRSGELIIQP
jgi:peptidoglycan/xylan/chitin deacetylase (PgdA/CDA1 family)